MTIDNNVLIAVLIAGFAILGAVAGGFFTFLAFRRQDALSSMHKERQWLCSQVIAYNHLAFRLSKEVATLLNAAVIKNGSVEESKFWNVLTPSTGKKVEPDYILTQSCESIEREGFARPTMSISEAQQLASLKSPYQLK